MRLACIAQRTDLFTTHYDPTIGRYLQPDPKLGDEKGLSGVLGARSTATPKTMPMVTTARQLTPYAYAGDNPIAYSDSDGRDYVNRPKCSAQREQEIQNLWNRLFPDQCEQCELAVACEIEACDLSGPQEHYLVEKMIAMLSQTSTTFVL
jgi:hypothetical protein